MRRDYIAAAFMFLALGGLYVLAHYFIAAGIVGAVLMALMGMFSLARSDEPETPYKAEGTDD